jgi:hypothetical protein
MGFGLIHDTSYNTALDTMFVKAYAEIKWFDTSKCGYQERPPTPEEFQGQIFSALADGVSSFAHQQPVDLPDYDIVGNSCPALLGVELKRDTADTIPWWSNGYHSSHYYNFGHLIM